MIRISRQAYLTLLFALTILFVSGCGSGPKEPGRYYSDSWDYSIKFPEGWQLEEVENGMIVSAYCPLEDEYDLLYESVTVSVDDMLINVDLDEYFNAVQRSARIDFVRFNEEQTDDITLGNARAKRTVFTYEEDGEMVKTLGYCVVKGSKAFLISCVTAEYAFDNYVSAFEQAAESFRLE